jgi:hypothetical protein
MSDKALGNEMFREKPDISQVFIRQLDRTNHAGSMIYDSAVQQKLNNLPMHRRQWVIDQSGKYEDDRETLVYKTFCGVRLGEGTPFRHDETIPFTRIEGEIDPDDPNIKSIDEEGTITLHDENIPVKRLLGEIDLDDPNIISPKLKLITHIDYHKLDAIIMQAAEFAGLTWSIDPIEQDAGDTEEYIIERKRTPFRKPRIPDTEG